MKNMYSCETRNCSYHSIQSRTPLGTWNTNNTAHQLIHCPSPACTQAPRETWPNTPFCFSWV